MQQGDRVAVNRASVSQREASGSRWRRAAPCNDGIGQACQPIALLQSHEITLVVAVEAAEVHAVSLNHVNEVVCGRPCGGVSIATTSKYDQRPGAVVRTLPAQPSNPSTPLSWHYKWHACGGGIPRERRPT